MPLDPPNYRIQLDAPREGGRKCHKLLHGGLEVAAVVRDPWTSNGFGQGSRSFAKNKQTMSYAGVSQYDLRFGSHHGLSVLLG